MRYQLFDPSSAFLAPVPLAGTGHVMCVTSQVRPTQCRSPTAVMERADLTTEDWIQETCLISAVTSGPTEPRTFQEA